MKRGNVNPKFLKNNDEKVASVEKCQRLTGFLQKKTKNEKDRNAYHVSVFWSWWADSNRRPVHYE